MTVSLHSSDDVFAALQAYGQRSSVGQQTNIRLGSNMTLDLPPEALAGNAVRKA